MPSPATLAERLLDLAFPATCAGCGREGDADLSGLPARPRCPARDLPAGVPIGLPADLPAPLLQVEWCAPFSGVVRDALHQLKYAGERRLGRARSASAVAAAGAAGAPAATLLVPVPVHRDRPRQRGYDQAVLLAAAAARGPGPARRWRPSSAGAPPPPSSSSIGRAARPTSAAPSGSRSIAAAGHRRPLGRARRRRRDHRCDARGVRHRCSMAPARVRRLRRHRGARALDGPVTAADPVPAGPRPPGLYSVFDRDGPGGAHEDDRQGQEHRGPGPRPRVRGAQARPARAARWTTGATRWSSSPIEHHRSADDSHIVDVTLGHRRPDPPQPRGRARRYQAGHRRGRRQDRATGRRPQGASRACAPGRSRRSRSCARIADGTAEPGRSRGSSRSSASRSSRCSRRTRSREMEELGHSFFVFVNAENERIAVLYRRDDGDYRADRARRRRRLHDRAARRPAGADRPHGVRLGTPTACHAVIDRWRRRTPVPAGGAGHAGRCRPCSDAAPRRPDGRARGAG